MHGGSIRGRGVFDDLRYIYFNLKRSPWPKGFSI